ncbi:pentapeptide repeat-containing protein [Aerosakkonema funiforme]|uniref:Pentapeptide repeat-containing protein n=2 Tax=Oscillatoriophycideae TaxID=1301283 RepID=A0A926VM58_9CYAN|nr:pentapeptide repeat-containing protein [Aerosakkonema funiforme]MBD2186223.1 pentapeptide repeat-containing protein [Aerosakkonema funiforme FACHB-1375]
MANEQQLALLKEGVDVWNEWRQNNPQIRPDLSEAELEQHDLGGINLMEANLRSCNLSSANLMGANLRFCDLSSANLSQAYLSNADFFEANLCEANLSEAYLFEANLSRVNLNGADLQWAYLGQADLSGTYTIEANLSEADLRGAYLLGTNLSDANLQRANLSGADLQAADLRRANLDGANLMGARLLKTNFEDAKLTNCAIYGISCWELNLQGAKQSNLAIAPPGETAIVVDNLELAQFIYLLLNQKKIRQLIDSSPSEVVLVLGSFLSQQRKDILEAIQDRLRLHCYLPVVFALDSSTNRDIADTISCLAKMARFILVDLTEAKNIPQQLQDILPQLERVPVQPFVQAKAGEYPIFENSQLSWLLPTYRYRDLKDLIDYLQEKTIPIVEVKAEKLIKD